MSDAAHPTENRCELKNKYREKVWSRGDLCQVQWPGDGQYYNGKIKKIIRSNSNKVCALISFDNFGKDDDEEFDVSELQERKSSACPSKKARTNTQSRKGLFSPLSGNEDKERLEEKYGNEDDFDEIASSASTVVQQKETPKPVTRKKSCVASGGSSKSTKQTKTVPVKERGVSVISLSSDDELGRRKSTFDIDDAEEKHGFTDDLLEKPNFSFQASSTKDPYVLQDKEPLIQVPATINRYLRDYQRDGIRFLFSHYKEKKGAILGDDMGLGKTVQVIGFLAALLEKQGNREDILKQKPSFIRKLSDSKYENKGQKTNPFLIIGPGSVLYNWLDELETWGYFSARKYHGADKEACLSEILKGKIEIVVTTFETFRDNQKELCKVEWEAVIVDEVHRIKDMKSQTTKALRRIPTQVRFGLTGTALQNNMSELWCILDWAQPGVLGSHADFNDDFVKPIEKGQRVDSTKRELAEARKLKEKFSKIRNQMMIRRMKTLISDQLPEKDDNVVFCKLSDLQTSVYRAILNHPDLELVLKMDDPCSCGSDKSRGSCCYTESSDGMGVQGLRFSFMHLLLKVANHVALLIPGVSKSTNQNVRSEEICKAALKNHQEFINLKEDATFRTLSDPNYCGKMKILEGLLHVFYKTHSKVLIFSLSTKLLDILEQYLISSCYEFRRIDGSVSNKRRMELVREFNRTPNIFIFLISTKAGGLGLNLTGANRVIIFDPNWNPSHDLQAQDRAYRIGQRQRVQVYRLISAGTIEENVYLRQIYKQQLGNVAVSAQNAKRLFHGVQGNKYKHGELFGIKNMFQLRTGESCLTMDIIERNSKVEAGLNGFDMAKYVPSVYESQNSADEDEEVPVLKKAESSTDSDTFHDMFGTSEEDIRPHATVPGPSKKETNNIKRRVRRTISKQDQELKQSFASVSDVLGQGEVLHVHENVRVVGTSKAEDYMSRCAIQEVYELHQNSQVPAADCDPIMESSSSDEETSVGKSSRKTEEQHNQARTVQMGATKLLIGQTPVAMKRKHFEQMAEFHGKKSLEEFAEDILKSSAKERLNLLKSFYKQQHPDLSEVLSDEMCVQTVNSTAGQSGKGQVKSSGKGKQKMKESAISETRMRKRRGKALSFIDPSLSDSTESVFTVPEETSTEDSEMEVGKNPSPFKKRRIQQSKKSVYAQQSTSKIVNSKCKPGTNKVRKTATSENVSTGNMAPSWISTDGILYDNMVVIKTKPKPQKDLSEITDRSPETRQTKSKNLTIQNPNTNIKKTTTNNSVSVDELLVEMVENHSTKKEETEKDMSRKPIRDYKSVLDDFFVDDGKDLTSPKMRNSQNSESSLNKNEKNSLMKHQKRSTEDLFSDWDSIDSYSVGNTATSDMHSEGLDSSTLKDEEVDCFTDPRKWKKRTKVKLGVTKTVDKLLQESEDDYKRLFKSGKMRKRERKTKTELERESVDDNDVDNDWCNNVTTPSLFS